MLKLHQEWAIFHSKKWPIFNVLNLKKENFNRLDFQYLISLYYTLA